jgi:hypothetical protein
MIPRGTSSPAEIRATVSVLTFVLYGTVVDMQAGLTAAVTPYLRSKGSYPPTLVVGDFREPADAVG